MLRFFYGREVLDAQQNRRGFPMARHDYTKVFTPEALDYFRQAVLDVRQ